MATVTLSSAIYNASTKKYLVVIENANLIKNDKKNNRLTIELDQNNITLSSPICHVHPTIIVKTPKHFKKHQPTFSFNEFENDKAKLTIIKDIDIDGDDDKNQYDTNHTIKHSTFESLKHSMTININEYIKNKRLSQSGTSPINANKPNILKQDPSRRLSAYLMNITDPTHKANQIKRMLRCSNLNINDIAMGLPAKYEDKYKLIDIKNKSNKSNKINGGYQGDIEIVKCIENNNKYIMKSMRYKSIYELRQYLERYLIVYKYKFMDYKDLFIDIKNRKIQIIQPLLQQTLKERLCSLKNRKFSKSQLKSIILQLIKKIDCMHSAGYIHHDLKPSNIMFDEYGKLQIIDFDLMEKMGTKITTKGTVGFIAPELFLPLLDKTGRTKISSKQEMDIWSIGSIICYMAFKGRIPFNYITSDNERINNLNEYMEKHSFLDEMSYRENKWSFIIDVQMDFEDYYNSELFRLISDLLTFKPNNRPNTDTLLTSDQYSWFNNQS